jgi:hypothetical protein
MVLLEQRRRVFERTHILAATTAHIMTIRSYVSVVPELSLLAVHL